MNTGDDDTFFGLHVSPDLDTIVYTLAGRAGRHGWGIHGDGFSCLSNLRRYYDATWFQLGDADLATHIFRSDALRRGRSLTAVTARIAQGHRLRTRILPMSDDPVRTIVSVRGAGALPFQQYLVKRRGRGRVAGVRFAGIHAARPARGVLTAIRRAERIILPPSNPIVSIAPILALRGVRAALRASRARIAAISPLVGGRPVKGPLDKMLRGLGHEVSAAGVARLYRDFVDVFVVDRTDAHLSRRIAALGMRPVVTDTVMRSPAQSRALAATVLEALDA